MSGIRILRIILAILIPPLGVFLEMGVSPALFINILLTILGWLPGSIHAVWVITKQAERAKEGGQAY